MQIPLILTIIIAMVIFFLWWCVALPFHHEEEQPGLPPPNEEKCFSERCRSIIRKGGNGKAILMIHGFRATPQIWEWFSTYFAQKGYDVYAPLLPGCGTDPKDLEGTNFSGWYHYAEKYYRSLRKQYKDVYVIGHSMGGSIALKIAEETKISPDAVVTIDSPVVYNSIKDGIITNPFFFIARPLSLWKSSLHTGTTSGKPNLQADGQEDWTGYNGLFLKAGISLTCNLPTIRKNLGKITCPLFSIHDKSDRTVPAKNLTLIGKETHAKTWETNLPEGWPHTYHCLPMYHSIQRDLADAILQFFQGN